MSAIPAAPTPAISRALQVSDAGTRNAPRTAKPNASSALPHSVPTSSVACINARLQTRPRGKCSRDRGLANRRREPTLRAAPRSVVALTPCARALSRQSFASERLLPIRVVDRPPSFDPPCPSEAETVPAEIDHRQPSL